MIRPIFYLLLGLGILALMVVPAAIVAGTLVAIVEIYHTVKWIP